MKNIFLIFLFLIFNQDFVFSQNYLPVDGEKTFIKGVNLPWFDGAYGHDFGTYQQHPDWDISYTKAKAEVRFADVAQMNVNVMRLWVFQSWSGIIFDEEGYAYSKEMEIQVGGQQRLKFEIFQVNHIRV